MATSQCIDFEINTKSTPAFEGTFTKNEQPLDITGWTLYFIVKEKMRDVDEEAKINQKITSHSEPTKGKSLISLSSEETNLVGNYDYSIDYKDAECNEGCLYYGRITFIKTARNMRD